MFDDDDLPKKPAAAFTPKNLEQMSVTELNHYIRELETEIERAKSDIAKKEKVASDAHSFFKS